jgi:GT2 family glycosyltransferase
MPRAVSLLIPVYGAAESLRLCLESLWRYASCDCTIAVLDDATPDDSVRTVCADMRSRLPNLRYHCSDKNRGFVATCNWGCVEARKPGSDVLLLNSDTEVTAGFLTEMQAVLDLHEKHAVVTPRSNNATIFSMPFCCERLDAAESFHVWQEIHRLLPRYQVVPTAVGFCMLIKSEVLDRFGLFDEIYSPGYNEENDFVCRINRCGYSAVSANWAYVFHRESSSFGTRRRELEERNRRILLDRYPEYSRKVNDYLRFHMDPMEYFADLYRPHRPRILYDLFHLESKHCGTSEFALNLLRGISHLLRDEYDLYVGIRDTLPFFASELRGYRTYADLPGAGMVFDLVFLPCQLPHWNELSRMNRLAPRLSYTLLDMIAVRCEFLNSAKQQLLARKAAELSDRVFAISDCSRKDFAAVFGTEVPMQVIYLGTNMAADMAEPQAGTYILVVGNAFPHKGVEDALKYLGPDWPVIVLGGGGKSSTSSNVRRLESGHLTRQAMRELFVNARLVVYPSYYEGFGLPILDALALGKPVIVLDTGINQEIERLTKTPNLYRMDTLKQLGETVHSLYKHSNGRAPTVTVREWRAAADEYAQSFREILSREIDQPKLRARWDWLRTLESMSSS